ncbi:MAG: ABC transporter permease [Pseudomonadota bacterium]
MLKTLILKEIRSNLVTGKILLISLILLILISLSLYLMYESYKLQVENYNIIKPKAKDTYIVKPPNPLSIFGFGMEEYISRKYKDDFEGVGIPDAVTVQKSLNRFNHILPELDLLNIVKIVLSLMAIFLAFDLISHDRETGSLKILNSYSFKISKFLHTKIFVNLACLLIPFALITIIGILFLIFYTNLSFDLNDYIRICFFLILSLLYISLFFLVAFLISILFRNSSLCLILGLLFWASSVFIIPNFAVIGSRYISGDYYADKYSLANWENFIKYRFLEEQEQLKNQNTKNELIIRNKYVSKWHNASSRQFNAYIKKQQKLLTFINIFTRLSPVGFYVLPSTIILGTSPFDDLHIKVKYANYLNQNVFPNKKKQISEFEYFDKKDLVNIFSSFALNFICMLILIVGLLFLIYNRFRKNRY